MKKLIFLSVAAIIIAGIAAIIVSQKNNTTDDIVVDTGKTYEEQKIALQTAVENLDDTALPIGQVIDNNPTDTTPYGTYGYIVTPQDEHTHSLFQVIIYDFSSDLKQMKPLEKKMKPYTNEAEFGMLVSGEDYTVVIIANGDYVETAKTVATALGY